MDRARLQLTWWRARRACFGLSWPAIAAILLAGFNAAFWLAVLAPLHIDSARASAELRDLRAAARHADKRAPARNPEADLAAFYGALARPADMPGLLARLHREAEANGLAVERAEYQALAEPGGRLTRFQITLPARGGYLSVRRFLARAAREVPGLALDGMALHRKDASAEILDAQIRLTLFLRAER